MECQVHFALKEFFQKEFETKIVFEGRTLKLHKKIYVACFSLFTSDVRTKYAKAANAEAADGLLVSASFLRISSLVIVAPHLSTKVGILGIIRPLPGIFHNIISDGVESPVMTDDMFIIVALPEPARKRRPFQNLHPLDVFVRSN